MASFIKETGSFLHRKSGWIAVMELLIFFSFPISAQFYEYGQAASEIRWNQISSKHYRIVYPLDL
ncbi:hypothetical protein ACFLT1_08150, partial [Bacteroidota bacterium]